jgi:adenylate cyclase
VEDLGRPAEADARVHVRLAIAFLDMSSYTPLTEVMGDTVAARIVERFSELVREATTRFDGRIVDRVGDAFLLVFPEPRGAIACALEIERRAAMEPQFPAVRGSVHWGDVVYQEGGYVGGALNVASRIATEAIPHQILVTAEVRQEAGALSDVRFVPVGKRQLKGLAESLELFEARRDQTHVGERLRDPVCGMEMDPMEVGARLTVKGEEIAFCCEKCVRAFLDAPERYRS